MYKDMDLATADNQAVVRTRVAMIFQDPYSSLDLGSQSFPQSRKL